MFQLAHQPMTDKDAWEERAGDRGTGLAEPSHTKSSEKRDLSSPQVWGRGPKNHRYCNPPVAQGLLL